MHAKCFSLCKPPLFACPKTTHANPLSVLAHRARHSPRLSQASAELLSTKPAPAEPAPAEASAPGSGALAEGLGHLTTNLQLHMF